jgi:hypothetical protein
MTQLPAVLGALVSDGLGLLGALGGSTAGEVIKAYLQRRTDEAAEVLFEELGRGDILPAQAAAHDDRVAVVYHYLRSACAGAARINLRLLAKGIAGRLATNALVADEFLPHVDALAALSRDEIILIALMCRIQSRFEKAQPSGDRWRDTIAKMEQIGWSKDRVFATAGRALRSGYVIVGSGYGALVFWLSPLLMDLCKTVDFDDALRREARHAPPAA